MEILNCEMRTWLREHILRYIDVKYLVNKIAIFVFSGLISIAPIFFVGLEELGSKTEGVSQSVDTIEKVVGIKELFGYIHSSTDFVYALVSLSTIVLADVLGSKKDEGTWKFVLGLFHILSVVFGILIYAHYKTHNVGAGTVEMLNWICFIVVLILSFLSYINLAIVEKREEG